MCVNKIFPVKFLFQAPSGHIHLRAVSDPEFFVLYLPGGGSDLSGVVWRGEGKPPAYPIKFICRLSSPDPLSVPP